MHLLGRWIIGSSGFFKSEVYTQEGMRRGGTGRRIIGRPRIIKDQSHILFFIGTFPAPGIVKYLSPCL